METVMVTGTETVTETETTIIGKFLVSTMDLVTSSLKPRKPQTKYPVYNCVHLYIVYIFRKGADI